MKKLAALLAMVLSVFVVVACGGSSEEQITPETLAAAMDGVCADFDAEFDALGTRGLTNPGIEAELTSLAEVRQKVVESFRELDVNEAAQADLDEYITVTEQLTADDLAIAKAAAADDTEAVSKGFEKQASVFAEREKLTKKLGNKVCGQPTELKVEATGTAPPENLEYAEPKNTIEEAAAAYVKAWNSGNCKAINRNRHSDTGDLPDAECEGAVPFMKGVTVAGTEQYGPVGQAEVVREDGTRLATAFIEDTDGELRYASDSINDGGGLRPASDDNDSQESIDATVTAIRDNDSVAFNEGLTDRTSSFVVEEEGEFDTFSDSETNEVFVEDIRATDEEPIQLGLNSTFGYYYLAGSENDWVLMTLHTPGAGSEYRFSGYWPVPKP